MRTTLLVLLAVLGTGCHPIVGPVLPPALSVMPVHVQVQGPIGALVRLKVANLDTWVEAVALSDGYVTFTVPAGLTDSQLQVSAQGWVSIDQHVVVSSDKTLLVTLTAARPPPLPRIITQGTSFFALDNGAQFTAIEASDFNLFNRFQNGEDIEPILKQRQDLGFNMLRVWTLYDLQGIGTLLHPDYTKIPAFLDACARHGLYVEFTAYTSTFDPSHWPKLVAAVRGSTNVSLELVNENNIPVNTIDTDAYARPIGILASHGSNGAELWPVEPYWDYVTFHTNGASEEQRKVGHNAWEIWSGPTLTGETSRFPEVGMWAGASPDRIRQLAYDMGAGSALLNAGLCFHSVSGKLSVLFTDAELDAARALVAGMKSVDLACQDGAYTHRIDLEGPNDLRVYERPVEGHNCVVFIRK